MEGAGSSGSRPVKLVKASQASWTIRATFVCLGVPVVLVAGGTETSQNPGIQTNAWCGELVPWALESKTVAKIVLYVKFLPLANNGGTVYTAQVHGWVRG